MQGFSGGCSGKYRGNIPREVHVVRTMVRFAGLAFGVSACGEQAGERGENAVNLSRTARARRFERGMSVLTRLLAQISANGLDRARKSLYY